MPDPGQIETLQSDTRVRFLVIDDHPLFRDALHSAIALAYPAAETLEATSITEAMEVLGRETGFDLALLDLNIPGVRGFEGLLELRTNYPRLPIVIVSGHEEARVVREVISYGAAGFIPKSIKKAELASAVKQIINGAVFLPPGYSGSGLDEEDAERKEMIRRISQLTPQQLRVLNMLRDGLLNKQIAFELDVGETTVKAHVSEVLRKLKVISRTQAAIEASKLSGEDLIQAAEGFNSTDSKS